MSLTQEPTPTNKPLLVIVSGLSGAGKSVAIRALEDISFYCIDNLPTDVVDKVIRFFVKANLPNRRFALGMDIRDPSFADRFHDIKNRISKYMNVDVLFIKGNEDVLMDRYSTARRKHPLIDEGGSIIAAIRREQKLLEPVELAADAVFDTTTWSPHFLKRCIEQRYEGLVIGRSLYVSVTSFGFKYGVLKPADTIFDARFLKNPYFDPTLKSQSGLEKPIQDYIASDENFEKFLKHIVDLHIFTLPLYFNEGRHYYHIGIGCTGGRHRSVFVAERLAAAIAEQDIPHVVVNVWHRDVHVEEKPILS